MNTTPPTPTPERDTPASVGRVASLGVVTLLVALACGGGVLWWLRRTAPVPRPPAPRAVPTSTASGPVWDDIGVLNLNAATDTATDAAPRLATDGRGTWVAVWETDGAPIARTSWHETDLMTARSTDDGATWSPPALLHTSMATDQGFDRAASIASNGRDTWVVVWLSDDSLGGTIGDDWDVLFARSSDNGATWSSPAAVNPLATRDFSTEEPPGVVAMEDGRWVTMWRSVEPRSGGGFEPQWSISPDDGRTWGAPLRIEPYTRPRVDDREWAARVVIARDGRGMACGHLGGMWAPGAAAGVYVAMSNDSGKTWGRPRRIVADANADAPTTAVTGLATDDAGRWIVTWTPGGTATATGDARRVRVVASSDDGVTWSRPASPFPDDAEFPQTIVPAIAGDGHGRWLAVWSNYNPPDAATPAANADSDLFVTRFSWP